MTSSPTPSQATEFESQKQATAPSSPQQSEDVEAHLPPEKPRRSFIYERLIRPILEARDDPKSIALGAAIGMFVSLTPTVGIQMTVVVVLGTLLNRYTRYKMNRVVAIAMCWISNPVTIIPMYYGYLWLGWIVTGKGWIPPVTLSDWEKLLASQLQTDPQKALTTWEYVQGMFLAGVGELAVPMWVGSLIIAVLISVPTYPITLRAVSRHRSLPATES